MLRIIDPCNIILAGKELGKPNHFNINSGSNILNSRDFFITFYIIILIFKILF